MFMQCVGSHMRNNFFVQIVTAQKYMIQLTEGAAEMTASYNHTTLCIC
jgi:hypothetical protein